MYTLVMATKPTDDPLANTDRTVGVHGGLGRWELGDWKLGDIKSLKREALLFDQIALPDLDWSLKVGALEERVSDLTRSSLSHVDFVSSHDELYWLRDHGIVRDLPTRGGEYLLFDQPTANRQYLNAFVAETGISNHIMAILEKGLGDDLARTLWQAIEKGVERSRPFLSRMYSIALRLHGFTAFPILETRRQIGSVFPSGTTPDTALVREVVLKSMPIPDDQTAWQDIIEFRNDPESKRQLRELRVWTRKFAKETTATSLAELKEEIEVLLSRYERHMKLHRMKINRGTTETLVTVGAKTAEDLVKLKLGELAKLPFIVNEREIGLLEAELNAPNPELAYISRARSRFSG